MEYSILYFAFVGSGYGGVEQKIMAQHDALILLNPRTRLFLISTSYPNIHFESEIKKRFSVQLLTNSSKYKSNPYLRRKEKFDLIYRVLLNYNPYESICYFRYPNADFLFLNFLKKCHNFRMVTEHQEIENTFTKQIFNGNYLRNIFELFWGKSVRKRIDGFVGVTTEIAQYELKTSGDNNKKMLILGNGIDVQKYPLRFPQKNNSNIIKIIFVGSGYRTHGLHRLLKSLYEFKAKHENKYEIKVKVAGASHEMNENIKLVEKLKINDCVEFLGEQSKDDLNILFNWADISVGSLGLHRIGLKYSSTLKAREYFSRGIPFFWSTFDEDLPNDYEFIQNFEQNENSFNMQTIIDFTLRIRRDIDHPSRMRKYATENLDWNIKMKSLEKFLEMLFKS